MEILLHNITKIVWLNGVPARIWEGQTASGIPIHAFITRIGVEKDADHSEFLEALDTATAPSPDIESIPFRLLI